jgi:polyhydroxyalkanoate synthesis regulator phasin
MRKTIAAIATAAIVLGGFSFALFVPTTEAALAQEVGADEPETTAPASVEEVLADLVEDGVITEEQATQVADALRERAGAFRKHRSGGDRGARLETVADVIGIEKDDLTEALRDGQSIAEVAEANGSSAQAVIDALVAEMNSKVDQAIEDGKLTAEQAEEIRANAPERIESMVNGEFESLHSPRGNHRGMGPGPGFGLDEDAPEGEETSF